MRKFEDFMNPDHKYSVIPFWFWNDELTEEELRRQIRDFREHGVYGFVIHPRVGLPRTIGWMSDRLLYFMRFAVQEASRLGMHVVLYDEAMYPSGSSSGQVVALNPAFQCRCLDKIDLAAGEEPVLKEHQNLIALVERKNGQRMAVIDRPVDSYIRGLHYIGEGPKEDEPPAADLLNPDAVAAFVRLVYDKYAEALGEYFGTTIGAIFTDEPHLLGRCREKGVVPGTTGILGHVNRLTGYDFTPHLPALWDEDEPDAAHFKKEYSLALSKRLEETYYSQLYNWCENHGVGLTGHPATGEDIGFQRYFHIPGQDLVWRWVLPNHPTALEGPESTQAKCSSSAMIHLGRERNSNECFGAYGHQFTWEEMKWLADWCFVRGVNLLYPHAFYYSIRGCRIDERPPDVGPNSKWWKDYKQFADYCSRMSWLNTGSRHVCQVAILGLSDHLPWAAAKVCFQQQCDFNYIEMRSLYEEAVVDRNGIHLAGMDYKALIIDGIADDLKGIPEEAQAAVQTLCDAGRVIWWKPEKGETELLDAIDSVCTVDIIITPHNRDIRYRHIIKDGVHFYILCNEGMEPVSMKVGVPVKGEKYWIDPFKGETREIAGTPAVTLAPYTTMVMGIRRDR